MGREIVADAIVQAGRIGVQEMTERLRRLERAPGGSGQGRAELTPREWRAFRRLVKRKARRR